MEMLGCYDISENVIIIKRSVLKNEVEFCGVLIHEFAHYTSVFSVNTREFENVLTNMLGQVFYYRLEEIEKNKDSVFKLFQIRNK